MFASQTNISTSQDSLLPTFQLKSCTFKNLNLVDCAPEPEFDKLTDLVKRLLKVSVALVSIVDTQNNRQYFKSSVGLPEPWATTRQTPLTHSFCKHVAYCDRVLRVENANHDPLVADNLAVRDLGVVAYLGYPIYAASGKPIGALCAIETHARDWSDDDVTLMGYLAACVSDIVMLRSLLITANDLHEQQQAVIQSLSHDLKAPVNSLAFMIEELRSAHKQHDTDDHEKLTDLCLETTSRMRMQITGLAEFHRVTDTEFNPESVSLDRVVTEALCNLRGIIHETQAQLSICELPDIQGSSILLCSLFQNLFDNAIKYRKQNRRLQICVSAKESVDRIEIDISDNGIGIAPKYHDRIFGMFERLHSRREIQGTGLGLAICQRIVDMHNGFIHVKSQVDKGTTFRLEFPKRAL